MAGDEWSVGFDGDGLTRPAPILDLDENSPATADTLRR
ncbi:hypothetical protein MMEU_0051 [Mycobacterium marinum str. Europe]|nr:hypothetical protein MMEU_0051 [Mycobacterium marinum str. Europe]